MRRLACLILALGLALPASASPLPERGLDFEVLRGDSRIGSHRLRFSHEGSRLVVEVAIDIEVRIAFVTLYRYVHRSRETWAGDRLVALDSTTDDNGTRHRVTAASDGTVLAVEGSAGRISAPAETLPTSYWRQDTVRQNRMLDTMTGRLVAVTITPAGERPLTVAGRTVSARLYRLSGDIDSELAYGPGGEWIGLRFEARGASIAYRPAGSRPPV